jgi:hypothetical protein
MFVAVAAAVLHLHVVVFMELLVIMTGMLQLVTPTLPCFFVLLVP